MLTGLLLLSPDKRQRSGGLYERKRHALALAGIAGMVSYLGFVPVFIYLGLAGAALLSLVGVLVWALALGQLRRGATARAAALMQTELVFHALVLVAWLGSGAGFHYYLWAAACLGVTNPGISPRVAAVTGVACIAVFAAVVLAEVTPVHRLAHPAVLSMLSFFNMMFAGSAVVVVVAQVRVVNEAQQHELMNLASQDPLTGLLNRRAMSRVLEDVKALTDRGGPGFCVALADIDHFKWVNDHYGHETGDDVLKQVARHLAATTRQSDALARWGGEEFLLVLTHTNRPQAVRRLDRLRAELAGAARIDGEPYPLTMSFGLALYHRGQAVDEVIQRADERLYQAKAAGRDCVVAFDEGEAPAGGA